jgi:hypothetical protein
MNMNIKKAIGIGVAALTFAGTLAATSAPVLAWYPGYHRGYHPGFHPGFYHHGYGWGGGWRGIGVIGIGVPAYGCGTVRTPVFDQFGNFLGYRSVAAC